MTYRDFRDWLAEVEQDGEIKRISGAHWNLEMDGIGELIYRYGKHPLPALLFDDIPGYPKGYRILYGPLASTRRLARTLCLPMPTGPMKPMDTVKGWAAKSRDMKLIPPIVVASGPVQKNSVSGDDIDLTMFPVPKPHERDGGRYIGLGHAVIQKDPDEGWVNLGTYRNMVIDRNRMALKALPGRHGNIIYNKYMARGQVMPIALAIGIDPSLLFASGNRIPWGASEYDYAGGIKGEPLEVFKGPYTGLPLPASAEIVIEGECHPGEVAGEGPYGEWSSYYAEGLTPEPAPVIRVKHIYYRDDPILLGISVSAPPNMFSLALSMTHATTLWMNLDKIGIPGIKGVYFPEVGGGNLISVVAIEQMYAGHSKEVGFLASQLSGVLNRWTIVVDDDIDPSDLSQITWAIATRADPEQSIQIERGCVTTIMDPVISPEEKKKNKPLSGARGIIDACRPFEWKDEWYPVVRMSTELQGKLEKKWKTLFKEMW